MSAPRGTRTVVLGGLGVLAVAALLFSVVAAWAVWTRPVRESVRSCTDLIGAANRQDLAAAAVVCSRHYLVAHPLRLAEGGGLAGLPRTIHKNFRAWQQGPAVWVCPTDRVGPVYQFVAEAGAWKYDGLVGVLRPRGEFLPVDVLPPTPRPASGPD